MKVTFEIVDPDLFPGYFYGSELIPEFTPDTIPDQHWIKVENIGPPDRIVPQWLGLMEMAGSGEPVRNVELHYSDLDDVRTFHKISPEEPADP